MEYKKLGNSNVEVSVVTFGSWAIGGWLWGGADKPAAFKAIQKGYDLGITSIDTAPVYGFGQSEDIVGEAIKGKRDKFQILTKYTAFYSDPEEDDRPFTEIDENRENLVNNFVLYQNYPNPFNPVTFIKYTIPEGKSYYRVSIKIYDTLGRLIYIAEESQKVPGTYTVRWDGKNMQGDMVPSGIYFYTIQVDQYKATKKMLLVR